MTGRCCFFLMIAFFLSFNVFSQDHFRNELRKIISNKGNVILDDDSLQKELDTFFEENSSKMSPQQLADCYHDFGLRWYFKVRSNKEARFLSQAIYYFEKSADLKRSIPTPDINSLKSTLYNLGVVYARSNKFFDAIKAYGELIQIKEVSIKTINALRAQGKAYRMIGDYHKALDSFGLMLEITAQNQNQVKKRVHLFKTHISKKIIK